MTQEEKELLIRDLCARLPYGVKVNCNDKVYNFTAIHSFNICVLSDDNENNVFTTAGIKYIKPYLFPLSSMTEEQFIELKVFADLTYEGNTLELVEWNDNYKTLEFWLEEIPSYCVIKVFDWLNRNHFDYRGLIPRDIAIDATGLNIY